MRSLWTPAGEHFPKKEGNDAPSPPPDRAGDTDVAGTSPGEPLTEEQAAAQAEVDAMRAQLAHTPAEVVVANHCYGLFELAAIYLSQSPPMLFQARLAIDALGFLVDGLRGRLGEAEPALLESLSQLRLAFVRLEGAERGRRRGHGRHRGQPRDFHELSGRPAGAPRAAPLRGSPMRRRGRATAPRRGRDGPGPP